MKKNMGKTDRIIRIVVAFAIIAAWAAGLIQGLPLVILGTFAVIFLATSAIRWCPAYLPFGLSTCSASEKEQT